VGIEIILEKVKPTTNWLKLDMDVKKMTHVLTGLASAKDS